MIIVKLQGGLGNQMFQYAMGRSVSLKKDTELSLDISSFEKDILRKYALSPFQIKARFARPEEIKKFIKYKRLHGPLRHLWNIFVASQRKYFEEKQFHFDYEVFNINKDAYIDGYWNTEKYFLDIRDILLNDFKTSNSSSKKNEEISKQISTSNSVSIHIRRGDYANDLKTNSIWGTLEQEYYEKAMKIITEKISNPKFFVFSDDMVWVKQNMNFPSDTIFINGNNPVEDMRLMSLCKHNVIANSTFSWWGAWLNENKEKIVIGPKNWFKTKKQSTDTKDVLPLSWIKI